jgi:hypothetical protein
MAQGTLVETLKDDGRELVNDVVQAKVPIDAAWLVRIIPENGIGGEEWQFFLASPLVDQQGPQAAYQKIYDALRSSARGDPVLARISLGMIKVVGLNDPITAEVFKIVKRFRGAPPIYVARCRLGSIEARGLYIFYVARLPPPWQQVIIRTDVRAQLVLPPGRQASPAGWPLLHFHAGTVLNAELVGPETDPDPLLRVVTPDGMTQGFTQKSNTEPADRPPSP